jgi:hypothetical protein
VATGTAAVGPPLLRLTVGAVLVMKGTRVGVVVTGIRLVGAEDAISVDGVVGTGVAGVVLGGCSGAVIGTVDGRCVGRSVSCADGTAVG